MSNSRNRRLLKRPPHYNTWVGVFCVFAFIVTGIFLYSTQKIAYIWRWNRVPIYFAYEDEVEIQSEIDGKVESIAISKKEADITVKGIDGIKSYKTPADGVIVEEGELISPGDILATYKEWKPGLLIIGLLITLKLSLIASILGIIIGVAGGLCRISANPALKWAVIVYVELIRGSPLLVQILIWYFVLGTVINDLLAAYGLGRIHAHWYAIASLACFSGAYVTEIVRAGIQSIHRGQAEASRSLGMTYAQSMWHIILPQALRRILPPLAGQFISLIKDSSLLGIIAIRELTKATREAVASSLQPFELYFLCAGLYLVLTFSLSMFVLYLERRALVT